MKAITFLGTNDYKDIIYSFDGKETLPTKLFPKSLCEFFQPEELLAVITKKARDKWFDLLKADVEALGIKVTPVEIPDGHRVEDLWTIFDLLTKHLKAEDEVIFDITHSFRTLPFLSFLAANFLQTAKNVQIKGIYYGAFDAAQEKENSDFKIAPVFDLTPFIELSRWLTATDKFTTTGNASDLGNILKSIQGKENSSKIKNAVLPTTFEEIGNSIKTLSTAIQVNRPQEIGQSANRIQELLVDEETILETNKFAKPFAVLLDSMSNEYKLFSKDDLNSQTQWISWYLKRGQIVQAVMLMREWVVSFICEKSQSDIYVYKNRKTAEDSLNHITYSIKRKSEEVREQKEEVIKLSEEIMQKPDWEKVIKLWNKLQDFRNDIAHFGFRDNPLSSEKVIAKAEKLSIEIKELLEIWN